MNENLTKNILNYPDYQFDDEPITDEECQWLNLCSYYNKKYVSKELNVNDFEELIVNSHEMLLSVKQISYEALAKFKPYLPKTVKVHRYSSLDKKKQQRILFLCSGFYTKCPACDKQFTTESDLKEHFHEDHEELSDLYLIKPERKMYIPDSLKCDICEKICASYQQKFCHLKYCTMVLCPFCNENFSSTQFSLHVKKIHPQYHPFKCIKCLDKFQSFDLFFMHSCMPGNKFHRDKTLKRKIKKSRTRICKICKEE